MYKHIVLDCSSLLYANAWKLKQLTADDMYTGAMYGFFRNILFMAEYFHCNNFVFCWDSKDSDRKDLFPEYKSKRKDSRKKDEETEIIFQSIFNQVNILKKDILPKCGFINSFEQKGKEADDLIANIVFGYENCLVVTNDEDMYQLLDMCDIWSTNKQKVLTEKWFTKEYKIKPHDWIEVKSIAGCKSDDIPGVPGVGNVTAIKFILDELSTKSKKFMDIKNSNNVILRNLSLVELPMVGTDDIVLQKDTLNHAEFMDICHKYKFSSFTGQYYNDWEKFFTGRV